MQISQIRATIEVCNWARNALSGATQSEFKAMNVPELLTPYIEDVRGLVIAPRYARDIADQEWAIHCANKAIARWEDMQ